MTRQSRIRTLGTRVAIQLVILFNTFPYLRLPGALEVAVDQVVLLIVN